MADVGPFGSNRIASPPSNAAHDHHQLHQSPRRSLGDSPRGAPHAGRREPYDPSASGIKAVSIPSGPRADQPQSRMPPGQVQDDSKVEEPIVVVEEEQDPEKALEERRRKREEIMAKFKASSGKPATPASPSASAEPLGPGGDSVTSAGMKTGVRTGHTSVAGKSEEQDRWRPADRDRRDAASQIARYTVYVSFPGDFGHAYSAPRAFACQHTAWKRRGSGKARHVCGFIRTFASDSERARGRHFCSGLRPDSGGFGGSTEAAERPGRPGG